jgi:hypothetical protein
MMYIERTYSKEDTYYKMTVKDLDIEGIQEVHSVYPSISGEELSESVMICTEHNHTGKKFETSMVIKKYLLTVVLDSVRKELENDEFYEYCHVISQIIEEYKKCEQTENLYLG